jgi:hypothetical protein
MKKQLSPPYLQLDFKLLLFGILVKEKVFLKSLKIYQGEKLPEKHISLKK